MGDAYGVKEGNSFEELGEEVGAGEERGLGFYQGAEG